MGMMSGTANLRLPDRRQPVFSRKSVYIVKIESGPGTQGRSACDSITSAEFSLPAI
jgi:hypothetical protein